MLFNFHVTRDMDHLNGNIKNNRGFSLMEVLVVVSIVTVALLGITSLSMQNIQVQNINDDELVASMLAQEGVELVRNMRDNNWINLQYDKWDDGILPSATSTIDYASSTASTYNIGVLSGPYQANTRLYMEDSNPKFYSHAGGPGKTATNFYRYIETTSINDAIMVVCHVNWRSAGRDHEYKIESHLYNWR